MLIILQIVTYIRDLEIEAHIYYAFRNSTNWLPIGNLGSPSAKALILRDRTKHAVPFVPEFWQKSGR
jgi:hypothetical protein